MAIESITTNGATMVMKLSSGFGATEPFRDKPHTGIDIPFKTGTELRAVGEGVVERIVTDAEKLGNGVIIRLEDGNAAIYGHLSKIADGLEPGQEIAAGQFIGWSGASGNVTGQHLHFGLQAPNGKFLNPEPYKDLLIDISGDKNPSDIIAAFSGNEFHLFGKPDPGSLMDKVNDFSGWVINKEVEFMLKPLGLAIKHVSIAVWDWFVMNLPNIMGYGTYLAAILIIICAMIGKGGIIKPLAGYAALLILALCILTGV